MKNFGIQLPDEVIDVWPAIFGEVTLNVLPVNYVDAVVITFIDGRTWEIEIASEYNRVKIKAFQEGLAEIFSSYNEYIETVDVKLDTTKIRKTVEKSIKRMLQRIKL